MWLNDAFDSAIDAANGRNGPFLPARLPCVAYSPSASVCLGRRGAIVGLGLAGDSLSLAAGAGYHRL